MVFLKRSTTALLALVVISLASTVITSKAQAVELSRVSSQQDLVDRCLVTQYIVLGKSECVKTDKEKTTITVKTQAKDLLPTQTLLQHPKEEKKNEEPKTSEPTSTPDIAYSYTTIPSATLSAEVLFQLVNTHRKEMSLPEFTRNEPVCDVAYSRKEEIVQEIFVTRSLHAGFYAKNLPYYATENMIWQHTEQESLNWWLNSPVHRAAIEGTYKYACGVCNGEVCNMVFTNYEPKFIALSESTPTAAATPPPSTPTNAALGIIEPTQSVKNLARKITNP
ncbi:MAG TPA: hypothetical protein PKA38_03585 [Candidatus Levybacteria bacterium]|nr:hypothetical protein [Candidatus Levybacteria bacterium]